MAQAGRRTNNPAKEYFQKVFDIAACLPRYDRATTCSVAETASRNRVYDPKLDLFDIGDLFYPCVIGRVHTEARYGGTY